MWRCIKSLKVKQQGAITSTQWFDYFQGLLNKNRLYTAIHVNSNSDEGTNEMLNTDI